MASSRGHSGVYAGKTAEERQAERYERLVAAGLHIWEQEGWAAVSMRGVCSEAQLTDRYFYEHFDNRDDLLVAIWDRLRDRLVSTLLTSLPAAADEPAMTQLRFAVTTVVGHLAADPARAQILFGEHAGSEALERRRRESLQAATDLLAGLAEPHLADDVDPAAFRMAVLMGIGGFYELISAWQAGVVSGTVDEITDHAVRFGDMLGPHFLP